MAESLDAGSASQLPGGSAPTPLMDLPKPARRGDGGVNVPFDPLGYSVFSSLTEVNPSKPVKPDDVLTKGQADAARRKQRFVPKFATLESMYAENPQLVTVGKIRIVRIQPQYADDPYSGRKQRVSGVLSFRHPCIGSEDFARRFGGFRYQVFGLLDQENRENNGGPPQPVEVAVAEFEIPLNPNFENLPIAETDAAEQAPPVHPMFAPMPGSPYGRAPGMQQPQYPFFQQQQPSQSQMPVEPVLNFATQVMQRQQQPSAPISDAFWQVVGRQTESAQQNMRELSEQNMRILRENNEALQRQLEGERTRQMEVFQRPNDMVQTIEAVSKLTQAQKGGMDSDVMRQLRDDHERTVHRLVEDHERMLGRIREEHDRAIKSQRDDLERVNARENAAFDLKMKYAQDRVSELERRMETRERELREEIERRERQARDEMKLVMDARERELQARMSDTKDLHARELQNLKDMHDREIRTRDAILNNNTQVAEKAHAIEMRAVQTDLAKMSGELAEKKAIVEQHLAEKNKPLLEQVREMSETSAALKDLTGGGDDDKDEPEADKKWYQEPMVQQAAMTLIPKMLEMGQGLLNKKTAEAPGQAPMPGQGAPQQMGPGPQMVPTGLPPRRRRRLMFSDGESAPIREFGEIPRVEHSPQDVGRQVGQVRPFTVDGPGNDMGGGGQQYPQQYPQAAPQQQYQQPVQPQPPQYAPQQQYPQQPPAYAPRPAQVAAPPAPMPSADDWSAFTWLPMAPNETQQFVMQLNEAFSRQVPPEELVKAFTTSYPMAIIAQIPSLIPIDRFVQSIRTSPATSPMPIATGGGRRYLADVWEKLQAAITAWQATQSAPSETPASPASPATEPTP